MPLPSPWKTPSVSHSPAPIRRKTSLRHRSKARIAFLILMAVLTVCALNELRCMQYGCVSRISFSGTSDRGSRGGGATLPDDWKYRLGEQLKTNMGHAPPASPSSKEEMKPQKAQVEAPSNGALIEPLTITPTIDAPKSMKQHSNPALENASSNRWVDTPPGPASPGKEMKDQMKVDKQTYVNGDVIEPPKVKLNKPPTQASANPLASPAAKPSPGVQVAAEDLRTSNSTTPVKTEAGEKEGAKASPPPKVDKMKEKVDSFIAQKASPPATDPKASPPRASASAPASAKSKPSSTPHSVARPSKVSPESQAVEPPPPKSPPHTHDSTSPPQPPQPPQQHNHDTNNFGSMEMGLLMAGG